MGYNLFSRLPEYRHNTLSLEIRRATRAEWRQALLEEREPAWDAVLVFTRNAAGELVSEENHGGKFEYEYDALGNLSSTTFPDGRELATLRYGTGHLLEMQLRHGGAMHTLAAYSRDRLHREISRSQGVLSQETRYDAAGRVHPAHGAGRPPGAGVRAPLSLGPHRPDSPADTHRHHARNAG